MTNGETRRRLVSTAEVYMFGFVLALVPFHAFITVWLSTFIGNYTWLRLWPAAVTGILFIILLVSLANNPDERQLYRHSYLLKIILGYTIFVVVFGVVAYLLKGVSLKAVAYGILLDVRFFIWFLFAFLIAKRSTQFQKHWWLITVIPLALVTLFALFQFFVLPSDFLSHFGYERGRTIPALQTINEDQSTIRAQSFLRGPNQLGLYLMFGMSLMIAVFVRAKSRTVRKKLIFGLGMACLMIALFATHSRSAWLGLVAVIGTAFVVDMGKRIPRRQLVIICAGLVLVGGGSFVALQHTATFKDVILHASTDSKNNHDSNAGHLNGIKSGLDDIANNPLGDGPGTAGPASAYNTLQPPRISESQYLNVGQELGWFGLIFFFGMTVFLGVRLFLMRKDPLSYGLFLSLVGVSVANIFMYSWFDETLAYMWWGLAGLVVARVMPADKTESMRRSFINLNRWFSRGFDKVFVPRKARIDGLHDYIGNVVPPLVKSGMQIFDIGGGKRPFVGMQMARPSNISVIGVDIDADELAQAPQGLYDATIVADIASPRGLKAKNRRANLVICAALLEHVNDNHQAMKNITEITKKGGKIALFIPAKYAAFAQLNRILPEKLKRKILFSIFPESAHAQGFPAYYDKCTPSDFIKLCEQNKFRVELVRTYYQSTYFSFFFPAHALWRIYQLFSYVVLRRDAAESFSIVAVKE